jgi:hypothetical protein
VRVFLRATKVAKGWRATADEDGHYCFAVALCAAAAETIRPDNQRRTTILRYASWAAVFPISLVVRLPFDSGPFNQSRDRRDGPKAVVFLLRLLSPTFYKLV